MNSKQNVLDPSLRNTRTPRREALTIRAHIRRGGSALLDLLGGVGSRDGSTPQAPAPLSWSVVRVGTGALVGVARIR